MFLILGRAVFLRAVSVPEALESYKVRATRTLLFRKRVLAGLAVPADQVAVEADLAGEAADSRAVPEVDSPEALEASPGLVDAVAAEVDAEAAGAADLGKDAVHRAEQDRSAD